MTQEQMEGEYQRFMEKLYSQDEFYVACRETTLADMDFALERVKAGNLLFVDVYNNLYFGRDIRRISRLKDDSSSIPQL